ncbi:MAG: hypothetical protein AAB723_02625 [Patescibacteria group bacterium]
MGKIFRKSIFQKSRTENGTGQVKSGGRFDKLFAATRRKWGLATKLEHIRNRGRQNEK